jgi:hypothetical protein
MTYILSSESSDKYICECCNYSSSKKSQYQRHILTDKHKILTNTYISGSKSSNTGPQNIACVCGKTYKHRQSLYNHKKICKHNLQFESNDEPITKELVLQLLKQNQNLQEMLQDQHNKMYELAKEGKHITNNEINNHFNLNVFLNETCKDAINLMDFVDSLNVKLKDLEYTAKTGYAEGISQIFINGLTSLNVHERPIHCSDSKRDVLYIKDQNAWQKEDDNKTKLTNAIKIIGKKNIQQISEWQKVNPEYNDPDSKQNDRYMKMLCNAMSGSTKEESEKNYEKIIKNIVKEVVIDKHI